MVVFHVLCFLNVGPGPISVQRQCSIETKRLKIGDAQAS